MVGWLDRVGIVCVLCQVRESEESHRLFQIGEELGMLSTTRCKFVGGKLQSGIEVVDLDVLDQAKEVEVEE